MKSKNENRWPHFRSKPERTCSEVELPSLAREIAESLQSGDRLILEGNLGAGKSTLVRHILQALDSKIESQGSPTFALQWSYELGGASGIKRFDHVDLYRLKSESELDDSGLTDVLWDQSRVVAVEWLSLFEEVETQLRKRIPCLKIEIEPKGDQRVYRFSV